MVDVLLLKIYGVSFERRALIGCDHIGLGSDFDGIPTWPADVNGVEDVIHILDALATHNYSQNDIEKIAGLNFMRLAANMGII